MTIPYAPTSWNPAVGCEPVSEGCKNCWAMKLHTQRYRANVKAAKAGSPPATTQYARLIGHACPCPPQYDVPFGGAQLLGTRLSEPQSWRKPRTVAVCFMGDLFYRDVPERFILEVFDVMARTPQHTFLVLTKRAERMRAVLGAVAATPAGDCKLPGGYGAFSNEPWPLPNVWLGVTAENQRMADERIPQLLKTPAAHRWASLEPLLGPVDLDEWLPCGDPQCEEEMDFLDWVVVGGESGPGHRPMDQAWVWDIFDQCRNADVPYYGKQIAANRPGKPLPAHLGRRELPWHGEHAEPPQEQGEHGKLQ